MTPAANSYAVVRLLDRSDFRYAKYVADGLAVTRLQGDLTKTGRPYFAPVVNGLPFSPT